jgi:hypothetical protein
MKRGGVFQVFLFFGCKLQLARLNDTLITYPCSVVRGFDQPSCGLVRLRAETAALFLVQVNYPHGFASRAF